MDLYNQPIGAIGRVLAISVVMVAGLLPSLAQADVVFGKQTRVTDKTTAQSLSVDSGWLVWEDFRNVPSSCTSMCTPNSDLLGYNRSTRAISNLIPIPYRQRLLDAADGNILYTTDIYSFGTVNYGSLYLRNIATATTDYIGDTGHGSLGAKATADGRVAWTFHRDVFGPNSEALVSSNLALYDRRTKKSRIISSETTKLSNTVYFTSVYLSSTQLFWVKAMAGSDIKTAYVLNFTDPAAVPKQLPLSSPTHEFTFLSSGRISNGKIAVIDSRPEEPLPSKIVNPRDPFFKLNSDVFIYDVNTGKRVRLTNSATHKQSAGILAILWFGLTRKSP